MTEQAIIDLSNWKTDIPYDAGLKLCEELGLLERVMHGEHEYGRPTQKGVNVLATMMAFASNAADPENILKKT